MYFTKYLGEELNLLNGFTMQRNRVYLFSHGSTIKTQAGDALYYSDLVANFNHELKTVSKRSTRSGPLSIESGARLNSCSGASSGFVNFQLTCPNGNETKVDISTDSARKYSFDSKLVHFTPGLAVKLASSNDVEGFKGVPASVVGFEYSKIGCSTSAAATISSDSKDFRFDGSIAVARDGLSIGGSIQADLGKSSLTDYNVGAEYSSQSGDFAASAFTDRQLKFLNVGYHQKVNSAHSVGALFRFDLAGEGCTGASACPSSSKQDRTLQLGHDYQIDSNTAIKNKILLPCGDVSTAIEHRLANPRILLGIAAQFNAKSNTFNADKMGIHVTVGEF